MDTRRDAHIQKHDRTKLAQDALQRMGTTVTKNINHLPKSSTTIIQTNSQKHILGSCHKSQTPTQTLCGKALFFGQQPKRGA